MYLVYDPPCTDIFCLQKQSNAKFLHLQVQKWKLCYMFEIVNCVWLWHFFPYWNLSLMPKFKSINHHSFLKWSENGLKNTQEQIWHVKQMDWFCLKWYCKLPIVKLMYPAKPPQLFSSAFPQHSLILSQRVLNMFTIVPPGMIVTLGKYSYLFPWISP